MDSYTLKKHKETEELHLFLGRFNPPNSEYKCTSQSLSLCEKMASSDSAGNKFACAAEQEARSKCAEIGRGVCGVCVSSLYTTY